MTDPNLRVIIDDRERGSGVVDALLGMGDLACEVRRLTTGDYLVEGRLLVERKTLLDFARSIGDGRVFRQAQCMAAQKLPALLILEGRSEELLSCGYRREALQGALITVTLRYGIPVLRAQDAKETARLIIHAAGQLQRQAKGISYRPGPRRSAEERLQIHLIQGLPGVGPNLARRLLAHFGNPERVFTAEEAALRALKGLGRKKARWIRKVLQG